MSDYLLLPLRAVIAYISLFFFAKLMGKREVSQLTLFDYIVGITIGSITAYIAADKTKSVIPLILSLLTFTILQILTAYISLKNRSFRKFFDGSKTVLIENGKILERNLLKERINFDDLAAKLREKQVFKVADVEFAYLEPDGKMSVMKKTNKQPITPSDMGFNPQYSGVGHLVIEEGQLMENVLRQNKLTKAWLMNKLQSQGIENISDVMFAQVDDSGKLYIDTYESNDNN